MVDRDFLQEFKKSFFLFNGARGEIVNIEDLIAAIEERRVLGACLDVLPVERMDELQKLDWFSRLTAFENLI